MSERSKIRRAQREAKQERQAKRVIAWICGILLLLAICFLVIIISNQ